MFQKGDVVIGPFPAVRGSFNVDNHYLVVLGAAHTGVLVMFTTSLKQRSGGLFEFTPQERAQAGWNKPCRFDPTRIALFRSTDLHHLRTTGTRLGEKTVQKLIHAGIRAKGTFTIFHDESQLEAKFA